MARTGRGHTLIEILVVLAIIAGIAALVVPRTSRPVPNKTPPLVAALQKERVRAAQTGQSVKVSFRKNNIVYVDGGREVHRLSADERLESLSPPPPGGPASDPYLEDVASVVFHADGTMTQAQWRLTSAGASYIIKFSPFFGRIVVE